MAEGAGGQVGEIRLRKALQRELRAAGGNGHRGAVRVGRQKHLGTVRQLAHDFIKQVRRHGGGARLLHHGRGRFGDFQIEVGRLHVQIGAGCAQEDVGQDRDRVATLDNPVDVVQRFQKVRPLKSNTHGRYRFQPLRTGHRRIGKKSLHRPQSRTMWTGKMAELLQKMQEPSASAAAHFAAIQHDPQA
ncbi:hypothetical protein D3C72_1754380 [compost metagenome]